MAAPSLEVADILRAHGEAYRRRAGPLPTHLERVMRAILQCRTAALGGHLYACESCAVITERFNSCRNRHCPKCQGIDKLQWLEKRQEELLPVTYFHVVFTLPDDQLNPLFMRNDKALYNLFFRSASRALQEIAADPRHLGAKIGVLAVLHTWGQQLQLHPHLHCIVPGGGLSPDGDRWIASRDEFFLPIRALGRLMRGKFLDGVRKKVERDELALPEELHATADYRAWLDGLYAREWNVYCKPPFGGSEKALGYLARYTHRVAIDNRRLVALEDDHVIFRYKDRASQETRTTRLEAMEFLRRFLQHVLPSGFHRIRYSGLWANRVRAKNLERCRLLLGVVKEVAAEDSEDREAADEQVSWAERAERLTGVNPLQCPVCRKGRLVYLEALPRSAGGARDPPEEAS